MGRDWPALVLRAPTADDPPDAEELVAAILDSYDPTAIEDLTPQPLPPGGAWDPTWPAVPPSPTPLHWRASFARAEARDRAAAAIAAALPAIEVTRVELPDEDWAARSQAALTAVTAGRFIVAPPWALPASVPDGFTLVVIEPSMGFGTGHHETTRLSLGLLSGVDVEGRDVIDVGTGSGVLAMAAARSGAARVVGIDVDADALASARASAVLNPAMPVLEFRQADFRTDPLAPADVVLANLTGGMLVNAAPALGALVRRGGTLVVSGFDAGEADAVRGAYAAFTERARAREAAWVALRLDLTGPASRSAGP